MEYGDVGMARITLSRTWNQEHLYSPRPKPVRNVAVFRGRSILEPLASSPLTWAVFHILIAPVRLERRGCGIKPDSSRWSNKSWLSGRQWAVLDL